MITPSAHSRRIAVLAALLDDMRANPPPACCLNCDNWIGKEACCAKFGAVPEEHRTAEGCPEWAEELPF